MFHSLKIIDFGSNNLFFTVSHRKSELKNFKSDCQIYHLRISRMKNWFQGDFHGAHQYQSINRTLDCTYIIGQCRCYTSQKYNRSSQNAGSKTHVYYVATQEVLPESVQHANI